MFRAGLGLVLSVWPSKVFQNVCTHYYWPDVHGLAVVPYPRAHAEGEVPRPGVGLDGVIEVIGDGGAICQLERHAVTIDQGAVEPWDDALEINKLREMMEYLRETNKIQVW